MSRGRGWRKEPIDTRDHAFSLRRRAGVPRFSEMRFDDLVAGIRDQRRTESCVGHSGRGAIELRRRLDGHPQVDLSALGLYWPARARDGFQHDDAGAFIRSAMHVAHNLGVPPEADWPFNEMHVNTEPSIKAETHALVVADGSYERVLQVGTARVEAVLDALQARCPVIFGTLVDDRFESWQGFQTIPAPAHGTAFLGGHALYCAGFDRSGERIRVVNSWGTGWGDDGFCWMAAEWLALDSTSDVWTLRPNGAANDA